MSHETMRCNAIRGTALGLCALLSACAFGRGSHDVDRTPITNAGAGASIVYPGRSAPNFSTGGRYGPPGGVIGDPATSRETTGNPGTGNSQSSSSGGYPAPGTAAPSSAPGVSFLGGAQEDVVQHREYDEQPIWFKYVALPFAIAAAPFKAAADAAMGEPEPGPPLPNVTDRSQLPAPTRTTPPNSDTTSPEPRSQLPAGSVSPRAPGPARDYESVRLRKLERELAQRAHPGSNTNAPDFERGTMNIAQELAALKRETQRQPLAPTPVHARAGLAPQPESAADGLVDRNHDGRIDQWLYREQGMLVREILDDNFDGRGERTLLYDPDTHQIARIEEDYDDDAQVDAWTEYRDGRVIRRRSDADHDGVIDAWTYYVDGAVSRHERDTTGDGFRDRVGYYQKGVLDREEQDHDGDGHPEVTVRFDANENLRTREEDLDADGQVDLITHYQDGRLVRRELFDPRVVRGPRTAEPEH